MAGGFCKGATRLGNTTENTRGPADRVPMLDVPGDVQTLERGVVRLLYLLVELSAPRSLQTTTQPQNHQDQRC